MNLEVGMRGGRYCPETPARPAAAVLYAEEPGWVGATSGCLMEGRYIRQRGVPKGAVD
jgi:hypothetical protein